jgi:hypothetical protein
MGGIVPVYLHFTQRLDGFGILYAAASLKDSFI